VLVFTRTKHGADRVAKQLTRINVQAEAIHGDKPQRARQSALANFRHGRTRVLVATDIAARGIDVEGVTHVINYDLPNEPESYVHRIGRTGRAGAEGEAISLVCVDELDFLKGIERLIKRTLPRETLEGFEPPAGERPQPIQLRSQEHQRGGQPGRGRGGSGGGGRPGGAPRPKAKPGGEVSGGRGAPPHRTGGRGR
jgi:ATP-dependent RNA helicase RhlE